MKIENTQVSLGLTQIATGCITLLNAAIVLLGNAPCAVEPLPPTPADALNEPAKKGRGKAKDKTEVAPATTPEPAATATGAAVVNPEAAAQQPALTHEMLRNVIMEYIKIPGVGKEKAKEMTVHAYGIKSVNDFKPEQLPEVMAKVQALIVEAKAAATTAEDM